MGVAVGGAVEGAVGEGGFGGVGGAVEGGAAVGGGTALE